MDTTSVDRVSATVSSRSASSALKPRPTPLSLLRGAATLLPRPVLAALTNGIVRGLSRAHPKLSANLARLDRAIVHIVPTDLPYRFALTVGCQPITVSVIDREADGAAAEVAASVATLVDLLEGRMDSDTLFFRRDLTVSGNTAVIVGLRNVLDREEINLANEIAALFGPLGSPARAGARLLDRILDRIGARAAAMHRTLHPRVGAGRDIASDLERCKSEIAALTARLARHEAREKRRDERAV